MPYDLKWIIPDSVLYARFGETLSTEEFQSYMSEVNHYIVQSPQQVIHAIVDLRNSQESPENLKDILSILRDPQFARMWKKTGHAIIIDNERPIMYFLTSTIGQIIKMRFRYTRNIDEALTILGNVDASITPEKIAAAKNDSANV